MAANQQFLICDTSTFVNFSTWASAISANLAAFGWSQTNDTGQVMWNGMSITAVSMSGTNMTCTYTGLTGPISLAVGRVLTVTGWTGGNTGNNGTFVITALGAGTWTAVNASGVNVASGGTGVVTAIAAVPATTVQEIWTPNDGLTPFYLKLEYGNTSRPQIKSTLSSSTNGASGATGFTTTLSPWDSNLGLVAAPSTTATYECNFSGGPGRFSMMMWRNAPNNSQVFLSVERSVNSSGVYTNSHVTLFQTVSYTGGTGGNGRQQSLVFGIGMGPCTLSQSGVNNANWGFLCRTFVPNSAGSAGGTGNTTALNGSICLDTAAPAVGFFDYPLTSVGAVYGADIAEGVPFQTTLYGSTRTYIPSKTGLLGVAMQLAQGIALCMRYD